MSDLSNLFAQNRAWADHIKATKPEFFHQLARAQTPQYLWIGCADSRVPASEILGLIPGEIFVHRNVANVVVHTDLNCLSVMQFAVDVLRVQHFLVVGHYGCAGVGAALVGRRLGLVDNWLRHIQDVRHKHANRLETVPDHQRADRLCELNVIEQVLNVCHTTVVQEAWVRGQPLTVHGWIYALKDGRIRDLRCTADCASEVAPAFARGLAVFDEGGPTL